MYRELKIAKQYVVGSPLLRFFPTTIGRIQHYLIILTNNNVQSNNLYETVLDFYFV